MGVYTFGTLRGAISREFGVYPSDTAKKAVDKR